MVAFTLFSMEATAIPFAANSPMLLAILLTFALVTFILFNWVDVIVRKGGGILEITHWLLLRLQEFRALQAPEEAV
jgi:hypothetical protein